MKRYNLWFSVESHDTDTDEYREINNPELLGAEFDTEEEALDFLADLSAILKVPVHSRRRRPFPRRTRGPEDRGNGSGPARPAIDATD